MGGKGGGVSPKLTLWQKKEGNCERWLELFFALRERMLMIVGGGKKFLKWTLSHLYGKGKGFSPLRPPFWFEGPRAV